jgi:hypothetical protein
MFFALPLESRHRSGHLFMPALSTINRHRLPSKFFGKAVGCSNCRPHPRVLGTGHETCLASIFATGRVRCCASSRVAARLCANLSVAAGAHHCAICACRLVRHHGAPDRPMAVGAARLTNGCAGPPQSPVPVVRPPLNPAPIGLPSPACASSSSHSGGPRAGTMWGGSDVTPV